MSAPNFSPIAINPGEVVVSPVPTNGPLKGLLTKGTRIVFRDELVFQISAVRSGQPPASLR